VPGLADRYARVAEALTRADLPFVVGFTFLADGIRVRGAWRPVVKMGWVEGFPLNQVVGENAARPAVLAALGRVWVKLSRRLRDADLAHADLQHGNVLLVPGSRPGAYGLKLVDYDGMYTPALADQPPGEAGHPNFQHPDRLATRAYSPDLDLFPGLVILTALKALEAGGSALWDRYDNGDNLLFSETDFREPAASPLMRELWQTGGPEVRALVGRLAVACRRPIADTPPLDRIAPDGGAAPLDADTARVAADLLDDRSAPFAVPEAPALPNRVEPPAEWEVVPEPPPEPPSRPAETWPAPPRGAAARKPPRRPGVATRRPAPRRRTKAGYALPAAVAGGVLVLAILVIGGVLLTAKKPTTAAKTGPSDATKPASPTELIVERPADPPDAVAPKPPDVAVVPPVPVDVANLPRLKMRWSAGPNGVRYSRVAFTDDGKYLAAAASGPPLIHVYDPQAGAQVSVFAGHDTPVVGITALPGGAFGSLAADRAFALAWDPATGKTSSRIPCPGVAAARPEPFLYASPDGKFLVCGGTESNNWQPAPVSPPALAITDAETGRPAATFRMSWGLTRFTADGTRLVAADDKTGQMRVFRLPAGKLESEATAAVPFGLALGVSPDGRHAVYYATGDGPGGKSIHVYEVATGRHVRTLAIPQTTGERTAFSPDGRWFAVIRRLPAERVTQVVLVDAVTWAAVAVAPVGDPVRVQWDHTLRFSPDGTALVCPRASGLVAFDLPR